MTESAVRDRLKHLMENDWKEDARKILVERLADGDGYVSLLVSSEIR